VGSPRSNARVERVEMRTCAIEERSSCICVCSCTCVSCICVYVFRV